MIQLDTISLRNRASQPKIVISGPCSAESEEQVIRTAQQLKSIGIDIFRAGVWKPRTRPQSFEGVGRIGLEWLNRVQSEVGIAVVTEVATPYHVEEALKHQIDMLWIGARSTTSPFVMSELASSLRGVDIPILVKNPVCPDIALWIGAIERLTQVGITQIAAIHRGFCLYKNPTYRNSPIWDIVEELREQIPTLPLLCDPSHIGGSKELIEPLSREAILRGYSGLFIESHYQPQDALSDREQQVSPAQLSNILTNLKLKS